MRIGEVAERTGLSISNIRFYEKKGLVGPDRDKDSKYRNYTNEDLQRLRYIVLYRKMDLSVDTIAKVLEGKLMIEDALEQQLLDLKSKRQMIQSSIDLCQKMINDQAYEQVDLDYYLVYVKEEEAKGKRFNSIDELIEDFSSFTQFDHFASKGFGGYGFCLKPWMKRMAMITWCLFFLLIPIISIADDWLDGNGVSMMNFIFWGTWSVFLGFSFMNFQRNKRK